MPSTLRLALGTAVLCAAQLALAQQTGGPSIEDRTPPGSKIPPEKEAIDACVGKAVGDRVRFVNAKGKSHRWTCVMVGEVLAARSGIGTPARKVHPKSST
jgi:hypothetical protein